MFHIQQVNKYIMGELIIKYIGFICMYVISYFAPISSLVLTVSIFVLLDFTTGIWKSNKLEIPFQSRLMYATVIKGLVYFLLILAFYQTTYAFRQDMDLTAVKLAAGFLCWIEIQSVNENFKIVTGQGLIGHFIALLRQLTKR